MSGTHTFRAALMGAAVAVVVAVCALCVLVDARTAMYVFAAFLVVLGGLRLLAPAEAVPTVRSRAFDVVVLLGLAVAIGLLAPWGNADVPVTG